MQVVRITLKPLSIILAFFVIMISGPVQSVMAAMIGTETMIEAYQGQEARNRINGLLAREDVRQALINQGIDLREARARIDSLSDAEAVAVADRLDQVPAGSGPVEAVLIISLIVFLVLLLTDILGYTDIFPFVNK